MTRACRTGVIIAVGAISLGLASRSLIRATPLIVTGPERLEPRQAIVRDLSAGAVHEYRFDAPSASFVQLVLVQRNLLATLVLGGPDGRPLVEHESLSGAWAVDWIPVVTDKGGEHRLSIHCAASCDKAGQYELTLQIVRPAAETDRARLTAYTIFRDAERSRQSGTAESVKRAIGLYDAAFESWRSIGDTHGQAQARNGVAHAYHHIGAVEPARQSYEQAISLWREVGDRLQEAEAQENLGVMLAATGEPRKALELFHTVLPVFRALRHRHDEAETLHEIGSTSRQIGELQRSFDAFQESLAIRRELRDAREEATTLDQLAVLYGVLGDDERQLECLREVLAIRTAIHDRRGQGAMLNNLGTAHFRHGAYAEANDDFTKALAIVREVGDRRNEAAVLNNLGRLSAAMGDSDQALAHLNLALATKRSVDDRATEAKTRNNLGLVYSSIGDAERAREEFSTALELARATKDPGTEATALAALARLERDAGNGRAALAHISDAIAVVEAVRGKVAVQDLRGAYFSSVQMYYRLYIDVLAGLTTERRIDRPDIRALEVSERARARSLVELLAETQVDLRRGVNSELLAREQAVRQRLNAAAEFGLREKDSNHAVQAAEIELLIDEHRRIEAAIRETSPQYAAVVVPLATSAARIQGELLDSGTLLLEYALGEDRSFLWAVTDDSVEMFVLPPQRDIEALAQGIYDRMIARGVRPAGETTSDRRLRIAAADKELPHFAEQLSEMVLGPVARKLANKRLLVVPDGKLYYVPFAALPSPVAASSDTPRPLIADHEVVSVPSAAALAALRAMIVRRAPASRAVAVFADPVFDRNDPRVSNPGIRPAPLVSSLQALRDGGGRLTRLPFTRLEADAIVKATADGGGGTRRALGFEATRALVMDPETSEYRILHFATHAVMNEQRPALSGLVLSLIDRDGGVQEGFVGVQDIASLRLSADLVVLSACRTALGQELRGEGLVGLTRAFMLAGVPRVLATLWQVDDEASAVVMRHFYAKMLGAGLAPAAALRAAQVEISQDKRWRAPYFWAAYLLQGDWQ